MALSFVVFFGVLGMGSGSDVGLFLEAIAVFDPTKGFDVAFELAASLDVTSGMALGASSGFGVALVFGVAFGLVVVFFVVAAIGVWCLLGPLAIPVGRASVAIFDAGVISFLMIKTGTVSRASAWDEEEAEAFSSDLLCDRVLGLPQPRSSSLCRTDLYGAVGAVATMLASVGQSSSSSDAATNPSLACASSGPGESSILTMTSSAVLE